MARNSPEPSSQVLANWELALIAERNAQDNTSSCWFCEQEGVKRPWSMPGTVAETREAYAAHRMEAHPEKQAKKQLRRKRLFGQMSTTSQLSDNIANTRAQGGAQWAGPDA